MGALQNLEKGEFEAALNDIETSLKNLFTDEVVPALRTFIHTFASDFGSQALSIAATAVGQAIAGTSIQDIAASVLPQITAAAITDAEKSGETVLNAVRVQLTAQSNATAPQPVPQPEV